jgi:Spy/CpxP family protein refolding chaperone
MIARLTRNPLFALATFALSASIALSQQTPPPASSTAPAPSAAPIERQPPPNRGMRPGMQQGMRPGMMQGNMQPGMQQHLRHARMMNDFRGHEGGGFHIGPMGMWWKNPMVVQRLTLTPEQTKKMDDIFQQSRLQLIDLKANVEKQQVLLEPMLSANPLDTNKAMAQIDKVAQSRADLEKANAKMLLGIRATLTPDQWTKLSTRGGGPDGFNPQGGPGTQGGPGQSGGPGGGQGRGRGQRPGAPGTSDFVEPIQQP